MKKTGLRQNDSGGAHNDPRLRFFRDFVSELLRKLPELPNRQEPEEFVELETELFVALTKERRRLAEAYGEEPFLLAAGLADELLQNLDWPGRDWWKNNLLELKVFGTRTIGDRFYQIADRLMENRRRTDLPTALILLDALALGFRGRLSDSPEDEGRWYQYRNGLAAWIREMSDERDFRLRESDSSFNDRPDQASLPGIPSIRRWASMAALAFVGMLLFSHLFWWSQVYSVHEAVNQATAISTPPPERVEKTDDGKGGE